MKTNMPIVSTSKFILRDITLDDYLDYFIIGNSFNNTKYLTWGPFENPIEAQIAIEKIHYARKAEGLPVGYAICLKKSNEMIGIIEFHTYHKYEDSLELGFILREDMHHKGIMTKCIKIMKYLAFTYLNVSKIVVGHVDLNIDCQKLVLNSGFVYDHTEFSKFKLKDKLEYRNIIYYSLYKNDYEVSDEGFVVQEGL